MAMFLIDNDKSYSYDDLLQSLNMSSEYCQLYKTSDIYSYFVNLIKALAANKPLVLLDSDLNPAEIDGIDDVCDRDDTSVFMKKVSSLHWNCDYCFCFCFIHLLSLLFLCSIA